VVDPEPDAVKLWEDPADDRPLLTNLWNYTEFTLSDNVYTGELTCGDLTVQIRPADESSAGLILTATAYRTGCESLVTVPIAINVGGQTQTRVASFVGARAEVTFYTGLANPGAVTVQAYVDPGNQVPETNETNNSDEITVTIAAADLPPVECPFDVPPERCFSTIITR
jgi:hypothetical protein